MNIYVRVQPEPFDVGDEYTQLRKNNSRDGAAAMFVGAVRDFSGVEKVETLELEHYPGMAERQLREIARAACTRWKLGRVRILHRTGSLFAGEDIVFVGATAEHRQPALDACAYIMDFLKGRAPFWKKESGPGGDHWVQARTSDTEALEKW